MSISTPSQGTHFSDGVRTGPILGATFIPGANPMTPSQIVSSPLEQLPPGVFTTPTSLLDIIPAPIANDRVAAPQTPAAAGYLSLITSNGVGVSVITYGGVQNVLQLDCARNITIEGTGGTLSQTFTVFGWDQYGIPLVEQITGPSDAQTVSGNKAFLYIRAVYVAAGTASDVAIGVGFTFGLPYLITSPNYIGIPDWNGLPDAAFLFDGLANDPITTLNGSSLVTVDLTGATPRANVSGLVVGQWITFGGLQTVGGITDVQLNITAQIVSITSNTTFTYKTYGVATSSTTGGGASGVIVISTTAVTGDQRVATATTGDVRGTYTPIYKPDTGFDRLTLNLYNASADGRNYNSATNGIVNLNSDPITTTNGSEMVSVYAPNHQFTEGENVTIGGAITVNGITGGALNITAPVSIIDANNFTYVSGGVANANGQGGGNTVTMSPRFGSLYQKTAGRFGVSQFSVPLF